MIEYFSYVGSFDGAIKVGGRWIRAVELNRIDKCGWRRVQPTRAAYLAARSQPPYQAAELFPGLVIHPKPEIAK